MVRVEGKEKVRSYRVSDQYEEWDITLCDGSPQDLGR